MTDSPETENPVPLATSDDLARYTLHSAVEVVYVLRTLIKSAQMVAVYFNHGKDFMLTTLLDVDPAKGQLILDWGGSEVTNQRFLNSERNVFVTSPGGVKIQFVTSQAQQISFNGRPAFAVAVPETAIKLQRREFFRLETPISNPYLLTVHGHESGEHVLPLHDISLGGVGLTVGNPAQFNFLEELPDCRLDLREFGILPLALQVRNVVTIEHRGGGISHRMGCQFVSPRSSVQNILQRFIAQLERERNALLKR